MAVEVVYTLGEGEDALFRVGGLERGEFDAAEEKAFHLHCVVFVYFLGDDLTHGVAHGVVVEIGVVLGQSLVVFAGLDGAFLGVEDGVCDYSHSVLLMYCFMIFAVSWGNGMAVTCRRAVFPLRLELGIVPVAVVVACRLLFYAFAERLGEVGACLVGEAEQHP